MKDLGFLSYSIDSVGCRQSTSSNKYQIFNKVKSIRNNYVGNKKSILPSVVDTIIENIPDKGSLYDVFGGSGVVSLSLAKMGYNIYYNDILASSVLSVLNYSLPYVSRNVSIFFELLNETDDIYYHISDKFKDCFSPDEILKIERYFSNIIRRWGHPDGGNSDAIYWWAFLQGYLIYISFRGGRLNNNQVLSSYKFRKENKDIPDLFAKNRVIKHFKHFNKTFLGEPNGLNIQCSNLSFDCIEYPGNIDAVYIDPPYGDTLSNYGYMYSFFEEIYNSSSFNDITEANPGFSYFLSTKTYTEDISRVFDSVSKIPVIIFSYNNSGYVSLDEICEIIKLIGYKCEVKCFDYRYKYRENWGRGMDMSEYLIIATR